MLVKERLEALEKLVGIAELGGVNMVINQRSLRLEGQFMLPEDRSQICFVRPVVKLRDKIVVTFFSAALRVKKGFLSGVSKEMAVDLLRRNENLLFARYGIMSDEEADMVVASADYLLETLDPEEFAHAVWHVAIAADVYEKEKSGGKDEF